MHILEGSSRVA